MSARAEVVAPVVEMPGAPVEAGAHEGAGAVIGPGVESSAASAPEVSPPVGPRLSPQEIMKAIENDPIIRRANELFGAKIDDSTQNT